MVTRVIGSKKFPSGRVYLIQEGKIRFIEGGKNVSFRDIRKAQKEIRRVSDMPRRQQKAVMAKLKGR